MNSSSWRSAGELPDPPDDPLPWEEVIRNAARDAAYELVCGTDGAHRETPEGLIDAIAEALPGIFDLWSKVDAEAQDKQRQYDEDAARYDDMDAAERRGDP